MAQETKVGLLTGLAFIICFAVILTNRGRERFVPAEAAVPDPRPETQADPPDETPDAKLANATSGWNEFPGGPAADDRPSHLDQIKDALNSRIDQLSEQISRIGSPANDETPPNTRERPAEDNRMAAAHHNDDPAAPTYTPPLVARNGQADAPSGAAKRNESTREPGDARIDNKPPATERVAAAETTYIVQRGDSLSRIASRAYGNNGKSIIDSIFDANRSHMASVDSVRAGMTIILPAIPGQRAPTLGTAPTGTAARGRETVQRPSANPVPQAYRTYTIKKNDSYTTIARDQLGEEARWQEIFELNRDKFPEPDRIVVGAEIRLPASPVARSNQR